MIVCDVCQDTHRMTLGEREVPCTRCPTPCRSCGSGTAYCITTPCECDCHASRRVHGVIERRGRNKPVWDAILAGDAAGATAALKALAAPTYDDGYLAAVTDCIAKVQARKRIAESFNTEAAKTKPAYMAALNDVLIHLEALRERTIKPTDE